MSNTSPYLIQLGDFTADPPAVDRPGVYVLLDDGGTLIYVGQSKGMVARSKAHRRKTWGKKIAAERYLAEPDPELRLVLEAVMILRYRPRYNRAIKLGLRKDGSLYEIQFVRGSPPV